MLTPDLSSECCQRGASKVPTGRVTPFPETLLPHALQMQPSLLEVIKALPDPSLPTSLVLLLPCLPAPIPLYCLLSLSDWGTGCKGRPLCSGHGLHQWFPAPRMLRPCLWVQPKDAQAATWFWFQQPLDTAACFGSSTPGSTVVVSSRATCI